MTGNVGKVREAKHALEPLGFNVQQLVIEGVDISEPQCDDLEIVARSKLEQARANLPNQNDGLMVEDAGLFVDHLNGFPGVYSAYVLKTIGCDGMLRLMGEEPARGAEFQAVASTPYRWQCPRIQRHLPRCSCSEFERKRRFRFRSNLCSR